MKSMIKRIFLVNILMFIVALGNAQTVLIDDVPRDTSYTAYSSFVKEKNKYPFIRLVETKMLNNISVFPNIVYKTMNPERKLALNIFRPTNDKILPAVMMIHGGGWNSGSPDLQRALATHLAAKGFVTITVEYRLIPESSYPAAVIDLTDAMKWIANNANQYGIDKNRIAVSGCSAGGQLASLIGTKNTDGLVKAIVNIDGISSFIDSATIERAKAMRENGKTMPVDARWLGGTFEECPNTWKDASATYFVTKNSAPVCFINSSIARFHNGRDELIEKLNHFNIYSEVHEFQNSPHTFWHFHPWHISTVQFASNFLHKIFESKTKSLSMSEYDFVVAQDGSGDFISVQQAINAVPDFRKKQTRIFIRNGYYFEKIIIPDTKDSLILIGEDKFKTILSYNNFASRPSGVGDQLGTSGSASIYISSANFMAENLSFENSAGPISQAVAVIVRSDKARFINCRFLGFQDTLYTHKVGSKQYYKNCYIEGTVDFIFGFSTTFFDECELFCKNSGYIAAPSTPQQSASGYVFYRCDIKGENTQSHYLGRPWRPYGQVAFISCEMSDVVIPEAWNNWGKVSNEKTAIFSEYKNRGKGGNEQNKRAKWSVTLSEKQAKKLNKENVLGADFNFEGL